MPKRGSQLTIVTPTKKPSRWTRVLEGLSKAIGEALFGGNR